MPLLILCVWLSWMLNVIELTRVKKRSNFTREHNNTPSITSIYCTKIRTYTEKSLELVYSVYSGHWFLIVKRFPFLFKDFILIFHYCLRQKNKKNPSSFLYVFVQCWNVGLQCPILLYCFLQFFTVLQFVWD